MSIKKVMITGGAGFIGSHLVDYWVKQGVEVLIIDDLRTGFIKNIRDLDKVNFYKGSITDWELLDRIMEGLIIYLILLHW